MSFVTLILVRNGRVYVLNAHWRTIKLVLAKTDLAIAFVKSSFALDAGYLVVDCDRRVVMSYQSAFSIKKIFSNYEVFEL